MKRKPALDSTNMHQHISGHMPMCNSPLHAWDVTSWAKSKKVLRQSISWEKKNVLSPDMGLEPMTLRLKVWCSTDWANRAAHTVNQVKFEASNDFYASTRQLWKVGNQLPNTSNMLWNFNLALSTKNDITKMQGLLLLLCSIFLFLFFRSVQQHRQTLVPSFILPYGCLVTSGHRVPTTCRTPFPSSVAFTH